MTRSWIGALGCGMWMAACGGSVVDNAVGDAGGADSATGGGCPATLPASGAPCKGSIECEYRGSAEFCTSVVQCQGGAFQAFKGVCPPNGPACAPSFAAVPQGATCATAGALCDYADGRCGCSLPVSGPPQIDAGLTWHCTSPEPASCPALRPLLGTPCGAASQVCDYGACTVPSSGGGSGTAPLAVECSGGLWVRAGIACPL